MVKKQPGDRLATKKPYGKIKRKNDAWKNVLKSTAKWALILNSHDLFKNVINVLIDRSKDVTVLN